MPVYWYEGLSVNISAIDSQHKKLLDMINDLEDAIAKKRATRELAALSDRMADYAKEHFATEERLMQDHAFPGLDEHVAEHEAFIDKVMALEFAPDDWGNEPEAVLDFLRGWLVQHIHGTDQLYGPFLNERGVR